MEFVLDYALFGIVLFVLAAIGFIVFDKFIDRLWD